VDAINETLTFFSNDPSKGQTKVNVNDRKAFYLGGGKEKWKIKVSVDDVDNTPLELVERNFGEATDKIIQRWQIAYDNDIQVVAFIKKTDRGTVVMPNITTDGSHIYGKATHYQILGGNGEIRRFEEFDQKFLDLTASDESMEKIKQRAQEIADKATSVGIWLPYDDPLELVLHPNETWELLCLDLEYLETSDSIANVDTRQNVNNKYVDSFLQSLTNIRNDFRRHW